MLTTEDVLKLSHKAMQSGHWYLNLNTYHVSWSDEVFRIHGYEPQSFQPDVKTAISFYAEDDRERISKIVDQTLNNLEPLNFFAHIVRKDGTNRVVHSQGEIKYGADGTPGYLFGVFRDITEEWEQHAVET